MSVRSRTASTSSCRISPAMLLPPYPDRLKQPALGKEESLLRSKGEPVRHPRDVIGHLGGQVVRGGAVFGRHGLRMLKVVREERPDQLDGLALLVGGLGPQVHPLEQELPQLVERYEHAGGKADLG